MFFTVSQQQGVAQLTPVSPIYLFAIRNQDTADVNMSNRTSEGETKHFFFLITPCSVDMIFYLGILILI